MINLLLSQRKDYKTRRRDLGERRLVLNGERSIKQDNPTFRSHHCIDDSFESLIA